MHMSALALKVPPLLLMLFVMLLIAATQHLGADWLRLPMTAAAHLTFKFLSLGILIAGVLLSLTAVVHFHQHSTSVNPLSPERTSTLVTSGLYSLSRNPMYLGYSLILTAAAVYTHNPVMLLWVIGFVVYLNRFQILPEEMILLHKFGGEFSEYVRRVRRWI